MKAKMFVLVVVCALVLSFSSAEGGVITFSGCDWTTRDGGGNAYGTAPEYVVDGVEGATATGAWNDAAMMFTELTLSVGDTVSYDWSMTQEIRNISGAADSDWIGDMWIGFLSGDSIDLETYAYGTEVRATYYSGPQDLHFDWTFTSETTVEINITDLATSATETLAADLATGVSAIKGFAAASWNTEQDYTVGNFVHTAVPEPATLAILGLGCLLARRRR